MQATSEIDRSNVNRFLCENCGANMAFDARAGGLLCPYCRHTKAVEINGTVDEQSYDRFVQKGFQNLQPMAVNAMQVNCGSCGAIVNFTPPETATVCGFCGGKIVAQPKSADPLIAPEGVLPFYVTSDEAGKSFNGWLRSLWFAPSKLKKLADAGRMTSVYIPYWTYDAWTQSNYTGQRGDHYTTTETYTENGQTQTRSVQRTNWYPASGTVSRQFDDVTVPATVSLPREFLDRLGPWDLENIVPYEPAYLSGHKAQTYQVPLDAGFEHFKYIAYKVIHGDCENDIGGDEQQVDHIDVYYANITFKHLLLPIYAGAYKFGGKTYQIVINGRTGEVQGSRPYSWIKIAALVIFVVIILTIIALIIVLLVDGGK